ncbi:MAG: hypothetical protein QM726_17640 [Chitinophagaceae bacterium]
MKRIILLHGLILLCYGLTAQKLPLNDRWNFHSINQVGLLNGESNTAIHLQSVNGFQYKNTFLGVGVGLDYYQKRTIPLFLELKNYFGKKQNKFFVYGDGGLNFAWEKKVTQYFYTSTYQPAFYCNAGFGYSVGFANGMALQLNAGYTYKRVKNNQEQQTCPINGPCYKQVETYVYDYNRLMLQIGWMF